ncbi:MAG: ABC transporter permease [Planctomycetales bacterium]|nr:ABC transporter permease [Planctomycetales bacterium]
MVLEREILPYFQWLLGGEGLGLGALPQFGLVMLGLALLALIGSYLFAAARYGPLGGGDLVFQTVSSGFREMWEISPRRIWALARLAVKEAWRRRVVVALLVFFVILLFASWFLRTDHQDPAKLYISFVSTATTYLVLGIALLLSAFSLPSDFKTKTIYTVVTKPVRAGEIILGRIIGFSLVGTALLAVMALCSYVFVNRSLDHSHQVEEQSLRHDSLGGEVLGYQGRTTLDASHRHDVQLNNENNGQALGNHGHSHSITARGDGHVVSAAEGIMRARVPRWGKLKFKDRQGVEKELGVNVGNEWTYRSFIEGNTQGAAIWTFEEINESLDPAGEGLKIGLIVRVFRTHKGIIGEAIGGAFQVRNPETGVQSELTFFDAQDAKISEITIPRKLVGTDNSELDLFKDLASNGRLEIVVQCLQRGQYFGFAQPDCYLRLPEGSATWNYVKVYLSIWVQMVIVTSIGVAASAVLSGPVAMMLTVSFVVLGFFREFFVGVATGTEYGGGPVESLVRLITQMNVISPLEAGASTSLIKGVDAVLQSLMLSVAQVLPDFSAFSTANFAAFGFSVPTDRVLQDLTTCLAYVAGLAVIGYFLLRTREVAK